RAGNRHWYYAMIGHGGTNHTATNASDVTPDFGEDAVLPFVAPVLAASTGFHGNIRVEVDQGSFVATGGDSFRSASSWGFGYNFVRVGHGGDTARGDKGGTISILAGQGAGAVAGDILFTAGRMNRSHAHIG